MNDRPIQFIMFFCFSFCHVDFEDMSGVEAALALSGEELKGNTITVAKKAGKSVKEFDEMPKGTEIIIIINEIVVKCQSYFDS